MSSGTRSFEQRDHVRYQLKENIFVAIQGNYFEDLASVADLNRNGVGFYFGCEGREPAGKFIVLDLISGRKQVILRSLSARIVFTCETGPPDKDTTEEVSRRYGVKFINLSALQKRQLDIITKKYALAEPKNTLSS